MDENGGLLRGEQVLVVLERPHLLGGADQLLATDQRVIHSTSRNFREVASEHISSMGIYTRVEARWFRRAVFAVVAAFFVYAALAFLPQAAGGIDLTEFLRFLNFLGTTFLVLCALLLLVGALTIRRGLFISYPGGYIRFPIRRGDIQDAERFIRAARAGPRGGMVEPARPRRQSRGGVRGPRAPKPGAEPQPPRRELPPFDPRGLNDE